MVILYQRWSRTQSLLFVYKLLIQLDVELLISNDTKCYLKIGLEIKIIIIIMCLSCYFLMSIITYMYTYNVHIIIHEIPNMWSLLHVQTIHKVFGVG